METASPGWRAQRADTHPSAMLIISSFHHFISMRPTEPEDTDQKSGTNILGQAQDIPLKLQDHLQIIRAFLGWMNPHRQHEAFHKTRASTVFQ